MCSNRGRLGNPGIPAGQDFWDQCSFSEGAAVLRGPNVCGRYLSGLREMQTAVNGIRANGLRHDRWIPDEPVQISPRD